MTDAFANVTDDMLNNITLELDHLKPDEETQLRLNYARIHPAVAAAVARGIPKRQILTLLEANGIEMHHATLSKLFKDELGMRDAQGERVCCAMCGHSLLTKETVQETDIIAIPEVTA
jgi:hypothetical protein